MIFATAHGLDKIGNVVIADHLAYVIIMIRYIDRYSHYATFYGVPQEDDCDLTLGVYPDDIEQWSMDKQLEYEKTRPTVKVTFGFKRMGVIYHNHDKETDSFLVLK